ncbi:MAG: bifunctional DNA-formamidopyrimidine glycosylase/DNA-(apurinic or apyrimidinic site) lyase [Candidatus Berkelbacteria bacterium]
MPELPEVETIRRGLLKRIVGKKIVDLSFDWPKSFQGDKAEVIGQTVEGVERRAKVIQIRLSNDLSLLFHLKMTGQLIHQKLSTVYCPLTTDFAGGHPDHEWHHSQPNKHTRIIFTFDDGSKLFFNDMRKFGWCKVLTAQGVEALNQDYGLEPLDEGFTVFYLLEKAKRLPNRTIKQFLMDQTIAAGMGNIYTDESLFEAKISPLRRVKDIKSLEWPLLIATMKKVLDLGIKYGGTTDSDYVNAEGKKGGMQDYLKVYHKTGQPCVGDCGGVIERIVVGGRGTHFCPICQK